jgi:sugar transferase EpsL
VERTLESRPLDKDTVRTPSMRRYGCAATRRLFDLVFSALAIAVSAPLLGVAALAVWISMGSPVLFRQYRVGLGGKPFILLKLRTMRQPARRSGLATSDGQRVTRLGRFLRRTKLDELPELVNVLRGEMSIVGPRPLMPETEDYYVMPYARRAWIRRHEVRPGLTGWGQVNGNTSLPFSQRFALDVWYIDHGSPLHDLGVVAATIRVVLCGERPHPEVVERAEQYVYAQRDRVRIRREPRACDLPAPVGEPVTGASRRRRPPRKVWVRPAVLARGSRALGASPRTDSSAAPVRETRAVASMH